MRRRRKGDAKAWVGSLLVHGTVVLVAWLTTAVEPRPLEFVTYEIQLVQAPEDELVVETPDPEPPPAEEEPEPEPEPDPVQPEPEPDPEPEPPAEEPEPEPEPEPKPVEEEPTPETRPEPASVDAAMEGLRKDYPAYYQDIVTQMTRCFQARWTKGGSWKVTIDFYIQRNGSIAGRDIDIHRSSGNLDFDLRALEAVECAGTKLDPLPADLPYERLPVRFNFSPIGSGTDTRSRP